MQQLTPQPVEEGQDAVTASAEADLAAIDRKPIALVFDTETTGKPRGNDYEAPLHAVDVWPRIVQIGMALLYEDGTTEQYCELIVPPDGKAFPIPAGATEVHGITDAMCVERGVLLEAALQVFCLWSAKAPVIVAHNIGFDRPVVACEMIRTGTKVVLPRDEDGNVIKPAVVCTMKSTMEFVGIPLGWYLPGQPYKWPTLQQLHAKLFGTEFEGAHDAMADVLATARCYHRLCQLGSFPSTYEFLPAQQ